MKKHNTNLITLTLLLGAALGMQAYAADKVVQKTNTESVELTNLDDADSAPAPAAVTAPVKAEAAPTDAAVAAPVAKAPQTLQTARKKVKPKGQQEPDANADEASADEGQTGNNTPENAQAAADQRQANESQTGGVANGASYQGASGSMAGGAYGGASGVSTSGVGSTASGASSSTSSGTGTTASTGTTGSAGVGSQSGTTIGTIGSGNTGIGSGVGAGSGAQSALVQYRALMLQEASSPTIINANPAVSRRYLQVDRATYQARIGQ